MGYVMTNFGFSLGDTVTSRLQPLLQCGAVQAQR